MHWVQCGQGKKFAQLEQLEFVRNYQIFEMQGVLPGADEAELGKAYREFSRRRYAEARSRGRLARESEVIQLIIRQWEALSIPQRLAFLPEPAEPATPLRDRPLQIKNKSNAKTTGRKEDQEEPTPFRKARRSQVRRNYVNFYRFHFQRLMELHPNWSSAQASIIIGLKWREEKLKAKKQGIKKHSFKNTIRPKISGRRLFRMTLGKRGLDKDLILRKWKRLPAESKRMWQRRGDPCFGMSTTVAPSLVKLGGVEGEVMQLLGRK